MIENLLSYAIKYNYSDIHIVSGEKAAVRYNGDILRIEKSEIFSPEHVDKIINSFLSQQQQSEFKSNNEIDFAIEDKFGNRFRSNAYKSLNGSALALRPIKSKAPSLEELYAPEKIKELLKRRRGLILMCGPTGCGKSTSLSAMVDYINQNYNCNIITIEDPIEFIHKPKKSLILQREIGTHTNSFSSALRASLRENPDIILVGELRDAQTISLALTAAETGHLVMATLHTSSAVNSISRIIDVFKEQERGIVRTMLASSLNGVILQRLVKTKENKRQAAFEVLVANGSVKNLIRENKLSQINSMMEIGKKHGMVTMKDSIEKLYEEGIIDEVVAKQSLESFI